MANAKKTGKTRKTSNKKNTISKKVNSSQEKLLTGNIDEKEVGKEEKILLLYENEEEISNLESERVENEIKDELAEKDIVNQKSEPETEIHIQYSQKDLLVKDLKSMAMCDFETVTKRSMDEIKSLRIYLNVNENKLYYVVNDVNEGAVALY